MPNLCHYQNHGRTMVYPAQYGSDKCFPKHGERVTALSCRCWPGATVQAIFLVKQQLCGVNTQLLVVAGARSLPCTTIRKCTTHTVDYEPFRKRQIAPTQITPGLYGVQSWSRNTLEFWGNEPRVDHRVVSCSA